MKLRNQLLTLSLATLLVPWAGWMLVQELEAFLRKGQEEALLATARTMAEALPDDQRGALRLRAVPHLHLRALISPPYVDGYADDWLGLTQGVRFEANTGDLSLTLLAGRYGDQVYLHCRVVDPTRVRQRAPGGHSLAADGLLIFLRSNRGLVSFRVQAAAPGPLNLSSQGEQGGQLTGFWLDTDDGYQVELALPLAPEPGGSSPVEISLGALDMRDYPSGPRLAGEAGTLESMRPASWLRLVSADSEFRQWLSAVGPPGTRAWLVDSEGWVLAGSGNPPTPGQRQLTWVERVIYRGVAGASLEPGGDRPEFVVRFEEPLVDAALAGAKASRWTQDPDSAVVRNAVAMPVTLDGQVMGAIVLETTTDGLLLVTNRALGRIMLTTLALMLVLGASLWWFASRLSRRVRRLSGAVSEAMDDSSQPGPLPLTHDRDELGELARNNARLLRAVAEYNAYLRKLAGRLSHELKTPLAITRSSLDNLGSQALDGEARRYLERAREGLDRQASIVRAMSEATRLEAAIEASEWDEVDLRAVLRSCVEAYRGVHKGRRIELELPGEPCLWPCAPDLLAQALDKLVDNAISLTGPEDEVRVRLVRQAEHCQIRVANTGSQLPDVLPEQLFDSLVSMRERGAGRHLGLGLHIVRLVAEAHGGRVGARNLDNGQGVEFTLSLGA